MTLERMSRRAWLSGGAAWGFNQPPMPRAMVEALTGGPKHHFFGYYGIPPWNRAQTKLVCLEVDFQDRLPEPGEKARIGLVDAKRGGLTALTETLTWNL